MMIALMIGFLGFVLGLSVSVLITSAFQEDCSCDDFYNDFDDDDF